MRRLVRFVGATRPGTAEAARPLPSSNPMSSARDPTPDRPLDATLGETEQLPGVNASLASGEASRQQTPASA